MTKYVADLEGNGLLDTITKTWCGVFKCVQTGTVTAFEPHQKDEMLRFIDNSEVLFMANGIGYDMPLLKKLYRYEYKGKVVDLTLLSRLLHPERNRHCVDSYGEEFGRPKPKHEDWSRFTPEMLHRCKEDVEIQHLMLQKFTRSMQEQQYPKAACDLTFKVFEILTLSAEYGWPVDEELLDRRIKQLQRWMDKIDNIFDGTLPFVQSEKKNGVFIKKIFNKGSGQPSDNVKKWFGEEGAWDVDGPFCKVNFRRIDISKRAEVAPYLLSEGWKPAAWNYKRDKNGRFARDAKGNLIKTSPKLSQDDPFDGLTSGMGRLFAKRSTASQRRGIIQGWKRDLREDGTLVQEIKGLASTGRLKHGCVVNVPGSDKFFGKQMRSLFGTQEGYLLVGTDSAGCQNRMLAGRVGDPAFTEILINGKKEDKTSIHFVNQKAILEHAGFAVSYKISKNLNYAFMFGALDPKLGEIAGRDKKAGEVIREALLSVSPGFKKLVDSLEEEWQSTATPWVDSWGKTKFKDGVIKGIDGRPVKVALQKDVLVYTLQSDEAIMMQYALVFLHEWLTEKGWKFGEEYRFVCNMHDEFQTLVREDCVEEYIPLANRSISFAAEHLKIQCEHKGESDVGMNWSETH